MIEVAWNPGEGAPGALLDSQGEEWQDPVAVEDLFRKRRPKRFLLLLSLLFGVMSLASLVDAVRGAPLLVGDRVVAEGLEAVCYRIAATLLSALLGGWLLFRALPPKSEADQLTG